MNTDKFGYVTKLLVQTAKSSVEDPVLIYYWIDIILDI